MSFETLKDLQDNSNVVLFFTAEWCSLCKNIQAFVEHNSKKYTNITFVTIDVDHNEKLADLYKVKCIPVTVFIRDNEEISRVIGGHFDYVSEYLETLT